MMKYLFILAVAVMLTACGQSNAQTTVTAYSGKQIPVKAVAGADVTIHPIDENLRHSLYGYIQLGITMYPVYCSSKNVECNIEGTLFVMRMACDEYKPDRHYLSKAEKKLVTKDPG